MRLRSKGLGRKEMVMDFREYEVVIRDDELVVVGIIRDPITWDFSMRFCEDDYVAIVDLVLRKATLKSILLAFWHRFKKHHWSGTREEHLAAGKQNRALIQDEIDLRADAAMSPIESPKRTRRTRHAAEAEDNDSSNDAMQETASAA